MLNIIAEIHYIEADNCFLHLPPNIYSNIDSLSLKCVKGIVVKTEAVIYFSPSPEVCRKLSYSAVGLSPLYASTLGLNSGDKVILSSIDSAPSLSKIITSPFTDEDRQILEVSSVTVESTLLSQLRLVWPGQRFPIWISPSITAKLVVDNVYPSVEVGRLEEHTELIIGDVKESDRLIVKSSEGSDMDTYTTEVDANLRSIEPVVESVVCRLIPLESKEKPPFLCDLSLLSCPGWLKSSEDGAVYQLTSYSETPHKVFINLDTDSPSALDIGPYKSLKSSFTVVNHLCSHIGSKVLLSPVKSYSEELSSLLITPCPLLKKRHPLHEIENLFRKKLSTFCLKWGRCLLNSKVRFPLDDTTSVTITLRPLNLEWAYVTLISLYNLPISVNTFETSNSGTLNETVDFQTKDNNSSVSVGSIIQDINLLVEHSLGMKKGLNTNYSLENNFLLIGKHGSGKSHISNSLMSSISQFPYYLHFEKIDCTSLKGKRIESISKLFLAHLNSCKLKQPSILLIDHIDIICGTFSPELEKSEASFHIQRVSQKIGDLLECFSMQSSLLIFATCTSISSVNASLFKRRGKSCFKTILPIQPLKQEDRKNLIETTILNKTSNTEDSLKTLDIDYFSSLTDSYMTGDLIRFIEKAIFEAIQRTTSSQNEIVLIKEDLENAFESSSMFIHNKLKVQKRLEIKLSDVGGLKDVKEKLTEVILWPSKYGPLLNQCPLRKQTGVLIYGPPGSGKTLIARAIASESNLNFITVKGPELMSKYIGESEEEVRRVFENAQAAKPSLLFFDEFESLAPRRGEEQTGVTDRVVNQLLTALDGVEPISGVIVVAASSRPDLIDPALLRSGRFSHHLFCPYPNMEDRLDILKILSRSVDLDSDVDLHIIAKLTEDFSGADLKGLLTTAQIQVLDKMVDFNSATESKYLLKESSGPVTLSQGDLLAALEQSQPSLSKKDRLHFSTVYKMFSKGKNPDITQQRAIFA